MNVFSVNSEKPNESLLNKSINFFKKILLTPNLWTVVYVIVSSMQCIKWKRSQREMAALWMSDKAQAKYYCGKAKREKISTEQETSVHFLNTSFNRVKSSHSGIILPFRHICRSHTHILTQPKTQTPNPYSNYYYWPALKQTTREKLVKIKEKLTQLGGGNISFSMKLFT